MACRPDRARDGPAQLRVNNRRYAGRWGHDGIIEISIRHSKQIEATAPRVYNRGEPRRPRRVLRCHPKCADRNSLTRCWAPRRVGVRSLQEARLLLITDRGTRYSLSSPSLILFRAPAIGAHTFVQYQENFHGYRYRQVVQRQQGFWLHHA